MIVHQDFWPELLRRIREAREAKVEQLENGYGKDAYDNTVGYCRALRDVMEWADDIAKGKQD